MKCINKLPHFLPNQYGYNKSLRMKRKKYSDSEVIGYKFLRKRAKKLGDLKEKIIEKR